MFKNKTLLITGGTGSFGNAVIKKFLNTGIKEIRIFSRDEKKQDEPDDYVVATGETNSLRDFVSAVFSGLGMNWRDHVKHSPELLRPTDILISRANPAKAKEKLGWRRPGTK